MSYRREGEDPRRVSWGQHPRSPRGGPAVRQPPRPSGLARDSRDSAATGGGASSYTEEEFYDDYPDSREFERYRRPVYDRRGYGYPRPPSVERSYEEGSSYYESGEFAYTPPGGSSSLTQRHRYGGDGGRDSAEYQHYDDGRDSRGYRHHPHNRSSLYSSAGFRDSGDTAFYLAQQRPAPAYRNAWERHRDGFYEVGKELEQRGQELPAWAEKALAKKEAADKKEAEAVRSSEARWNARLEATEAQMRAEERRLAELAEERVKLEHERRRLEVRQQRRALVPETTYEPHPAPTTFRWTEDNREQMHSLTLARYEHSARERRRVKKVEAAVSERMEAELERQAYEYDREYYYLDKGDGVSVVSSAARAASATTLARPTWDDVSRLRTQAKNRAKARQQGRVVTLR